MKTFNKTSIVPLVFVVLLGATYASAATSPGLGAASTFGILASTYTNTAGGTTVNGDLGYTTGPAAVPTITGATHVADGVYNQAGTDQGAALTSLNGQTCSFTFAPGAIDLAADTTHGTVGVYTPGVYCVSGAASVGTGGITLSGSGTYIFRMTGALTTVDNSAITVSNGASACNLWWTPGAATTLGANSSFAGTDMSASGITLGNNVTWTGRALAFGGTISTTGDIINVPACTVPPPPPSPPATGSITVNKTTSGGDGAFSFSATGSGYSNFNITTLGGTGSNTQNNLAPGAYAATETILSGWTQNASNCGSITVVAGQTSTCTISNTKNSPPTPTPTPTSTPTVSVPTVVSPTPTTPGAPNTGAGGDAATTLLILVGSALVAGLGALYLGRRSA